MQLSIIVFACVIQMLPKKKRLPTILICHTPLISPQDRNFANALFGSLTLCMLNTISVSQLAVCTLHITLQSDVNDSQSLS